MLPSTVDIALKSGGEQQAGSPAYAAPNEGPAHRATIKKLPWLDGKSSLASSPTATTSPTTRRISVGPRPAASFSTGRRTSDAVTRARVPVHRGTLTYDKDTAFPHPATAVPKRRQIPPVVGLERSEDLFKKSHPIAANLAPVPDHLQRVVTPEHVIEPFRRNKYMISPPQIIKSVQISPTQPIPKHSAYECVNSRKLSNAIEGLEELVQEAVSAADNSADVDHVAEIHGIIEDAKHAIQEANHPARLMRISSPLCASDTSEEVSDHFSQSSDHYLSGQPGPALPIDAPFVLASQRHILDHGEVSPTAGPLRVDQSGPDPIDWAYHNVSELRKESPSSSSSDYEGQSQFSTRSDLLLPPQPSQTAPREHVDFVLRPTVTREDPRGRSHQRRTSSSGPVPRRHHHRRSWQSDEAHYRSRHRYRGGISSSFNRSFDEEDLHDAGKPKSIRRYGNELHVRDNANHHTFSLRRHHRRQPIARNWESKKKRITAAIACINTALLGIIVGIYAGEVPRIQYMLADENHRIILGNVVLYIGLAISTFVAWPLPLLHGRKPYILAALALAMPLQFPQALVIGTKRSPKDASFRTGLLVSRAASGLVLGFANVNYLAILLDLFGASLQSKHPHQEFTIVSDVRRHGGGMGIWLGIYSWCFIGSLAVGFQIGAAIITSLTPDWGFYIVIMILALGLVLNIMAPETRRSAYRRSVTEVYDRDENYITRRVARGEVKLHLSIEGPKYWFEEVWAGMKLATMMLCQPGFLVLSLYLAWIYAQIVLVIVLLGALLSRDYRWKPQYVGAGVMSIAIGALLAVPLTKAGIFSRERKRGYRTDSMTLQKQVTWTSHMVRRILFTLTLPLMGLAYTVSSAGRPKPYMVPITFAGAVGFLSVLALAECHGLIMETFDTCDLQPGVNTRHRLQSMAVQDQRRRTNYSSFPRVSAGIFAAQSLSFIGAAIATQVGGIMTRHLGAQTSTGCTAGILLFLTILLSLVLWRFKEVQVIPNHTFGTRRDTAAWNDFKELEKEGLGHDWKAVVIGTPSGKMRRMSVLELGALSRWTEIRKLNFLIRGAEKGKRRDWHRVGG